MAYNHQAHNLSDGASYPFRNLMELAQQVVGSDDADWEAVTPAATEHAPAKVIVKLLDGDKKVVTRVKVDAYVLFDTNVTAR